jgi:hypothetical protein
MMCNSDEREMLKHVSLSALALTFASSAFAQTTNPSTTPMQWQQQQQGQGSRALTGTEKQNQPVTPGTSSVPGTDKPNPAQKSLDAPSSQGGGAGGGSGK